MTPTALFHEGPLAGRTLEVHSPRVKAVEETDEYRHLDGVDQSFREVTYELVQDRDGSWHGFLLRHWENA